MLTHPENFKSRHIYSIKKKIQNNYETLWKINLNKCEKLRTYRKFKFIFGYETYISDIRNISHRNILFFVFVLVTTSSILKPVDIPVQLFLLRTVYVPIVTLKA